MPLIIIIGIIGYFFARSHGYFSSQPAQPAPLQSQSQSAVPVFRGTPAAHYGVESRPSWFSDVITSILTGNNQSQFKLSNPDNAATAASSGGSDSSASTAATAPPVSSPPSPGGYYSSSNCPDMDMFVQHGLRVRNASPGTLLDCLEKDHATVKRYPIEWVKSAKEECIRIESQNGAAVVVSQSTPVPTREALALKMPMYANIVSVGMHVVTDVGNGTEWSMVTSISRVGKRQVIRLYVGGRNFAAGETAEKRIFTHNVAAMTDIGK